MYGLQVRAFHLGKLGQVQGVLETSMSAKLSEWKGALSGKKTNQIDSLKPRAVDHSGPQNPPPCNRGRDPLQDGSAGKGRAMAPGVRDPKDCGLCPPVVFHIR